MYPNLIQKLPVYLRLSRAASTTKAYNYLFSAFKSWCDQNELKYLPAEPLTIALFFIFKHSLDFSPQTIASYMAAIKWAHMLANQPDPTSHFLVRETLEACKRMPKVFKGPSREPLPFDALISICKKGSSLASLRTACLFSLSFYGFLRSKEVLNIKRKNLKFCKSLNNEYLEIFIENSKTDQYKRGNKIVLSARQDPSCPVRILKKYLLKAGLMSPQDDSQKIFCQLAPFSQKIEASKPLTYTRFREIFKQALASIKIRHPEKYTCHSLRIGGASFAVQNGVPTPLIKKHGRWVTDKVFESYGRNSLSQQLSVTN